MQNTTFVLTVAMGLASETTSLTLRGFIAPKGYTTHVVKGLRSTNIRL